MSVLTTRPKFLYPHSRQFPFDEIAEEIVKAIEKRNWKVPEITLEFDTYGSGEEKYQLIRSITGKNFRLYFCRIQGKLSARWNDTAALEEVCIPKQILRVHEDESGPIYYQYVGEDWKADKVNLQQKFSEFTAWLKEFVLDYILTFPEADTIEPPVPMEELIPYEGPWETIYSICGGRDAERISQGKEGPTKLEPGERHADFGSGHRLLPLYVKDEGNIPKIAYESFIWCDTNQKENIMQDTEFAVGVMGAMYSFLGKNYAVAIKLRYANEVYVADDAKFEETRQQLFQEIAPREMLTDAELNKAYAARGATIVPITEYEGGYQNPIVLIKRELEFEEIDRLIEIS